MTELVYDFEVPQTFNMQFRIFHLSDYLSEDNE